MGKFTFSRIVAAHARNRARHRRIPAAAFARLTPALLFTPAAGGG